MVYFGRNPPLREAEIEALMHPHKPELALPMLRRQLEEILALMQTAPSINEGDTGFAKQAVANADENRECEIDLQPMSFDGGQPAKQNDLYNDALVVVTEFGEASPSILQMWLSIDYGRAITILDRFQADGLISSKGRVRHKAFSILRSLDNA